MTKNIRKIALYIIVLVIVSFSATYSFAYTVNSEHPRVLITNDNISDIRARCATGVQGDYYKRIKNYCDSRINDTWSSSVYKPLLAYAFMTVMGEIPGYSYDINYIGKTGISAYAAKGIELLQQQADYFKDRNGGHYEPTIDLTCSYDWLYAYMTPEERANVVADLVSHQETAEAYITANPSTLNHPFASRGLYQTAYPVIAVAYYGDGINDAKAQYYCDEYVNIWKNTIYPVWQRATRGGGNPFGADYAGIWHKYLIPGEMWNTATDDDFRNDYDGFPNYSLFFQMYNLIPYVTYLDCDTGESPCWGSTGWDVYRLKTYNLLRNTGSTITKYSDYPIPEFHTMAWSRPFDLASISTLSEKGKESYAQAAQWALLFHGSQETPPSKTELSEGPYRTSEGDPWYLMWDIITRDANIEAISPVSLDLSTSHFFGTTNTGPALGTDFADGSPEGVGIITTRSAWEDPDATLVFYKHSPYATIHYYRDAGSFQIYKKGWLAIDSGQYTECTNGDTQHSAYYTRTTASKNSLLIYNPNEIWNGGTYHDSFHVAGNSGGQRDEYQGTPEGLLQVQSDSRQFFGGINNYAHKEKRYTYIDSDLTRAYQSVPYHDADNSAKVSKVTRQLVYFPDNYVVVFDRINSTNAQYPKRWLLHSVNRPNLDGEESFSGTIRYSTNIPGKPNGVALTGDINGGISESANTSTFLINGWNHEAPENTPATGKMFVKTLLPKERIHRVVGGPGYEFMDAEYNNHPVNNEDCDPIWREQRPWHGVWRVEIEPAGSDYPLNFNTFLNVIETGEQELTDMATATLIESTSGESMKGVFIKGEPNRVVMFSETSDMINSTQFNLPVTGQTDLLIVDLAKSTNYYYIIDELNIKISTSNNGGTLRKSSDQGTVFLQISASGEVIIPPTASANATPVSGQSPLAVTFSGSGTDSDGTIVSYNWNFGDGSTSNQQNPSKIFNSPGTYLVNLTVTDNDGGIGQDSVSINVGGSSVVNQPPIASANATPASGQSPLAVTFSGSGTDSDGTIVSYNWNFGDGSTSNQQNPSKTFNSPGTYLVNLTVTDNDGGTDQDSISIIVSESSGDGPPAKPKSLVLTVKENNAPVASINAESTSGQAPLSVSFTGSGTDTDGTIESYQWDFGDDTTSEQQSPSHTYNNIGTYIVTLTVTDNDGRIGTASRNIYVNDGSTFETVTCQHNGSSYDCAVVYPTFPAEPEKGEVFLGDFNAEIVRVTDTSTEVDNYSGQDGMTLRYASISQENSDGTRIVLEDHTNSKSWNLYNAKTLEKIERLTDIPDGVGDGGPRWDANDPNVFYYTKYMVMYKYDLSEALGSRITTVRDFSSDWPAGYLIDWADEGEPDGSTRYWAVHCRASSPNYEDIAIACYDKQTNTILGQITSFPYDSDWVAMSPSGEYLLVRWAYSDGRIWAYNRAMTEHTEVCLGAGHADRAVDADGNDVVAYHSNTGAYQDGWYHMSYMDGTDIKLVDFGNQYGNTGGEHFSGNNYNRPGWVFVSTYTNSVAPESYTGWVDGRIFAIQLKANPRCWSIVHHRSIWNDTYRNAPMAQINKDGTRIYFGSNWGSGDRTKMEVYKIDLPANWWED